MDYAAPWKCWPNHWIRDADTLGVCQLPAGRSFGDPIGREAAERDVRNENLILAAPVLLEALQSFVDATDFGESRRAFAYELMRAKTAIKQATGVQ